jgi:hypothetical protein
MGERMAADYLSIGVGKLRDLLPPKKVGGRSLWDIRDLDRLADTIDGVQVLDDDDVAAQSKDVERQFLEKRKGRGNG